MIRMQNLACIFSNGEGLKGIDLEISRGEILAIIGPSGSGKSTILRCINLLEQPTSGKVWVDGQELMSSETDIYDIRKRLGMVFQTISLFNHKTLLENAAMGPMDLLGMKKRDAYERAEKYLQEVGLGEKMHAYPQELSGGQKQRGEIARCLAMEPEVLLLDEPTALLDVSMAGEVQAVLSKLAKEGMTMVMVTHDFRLCKNLADRVLYVEDGRIYEEGTPEEIFESPKKEHTRAFVQQMRKFTYTITSKEFDLYELNAKIENFGRDYFLSQRNVRNLELVIEELLLHSLIIHTQHIILTIQYYEKDASVELNFIYQGTAFNPYDDQNEDVLSMLVVQQMTEKVSYEYTSENILKFFLKM